MIALQTQLPPNVLIMVNPFVGTDEAQRIVAELVAINARVSDVLAIPRALTKIEPVWLSRAYALGTEGRDADIVFDMMSAVNDMLHANQFDAVDAIIASIKEQEAPLVVVEGLLRFCARAKARLPHWDRLKDRLLQEAARRGDTEDILFG
jgi:hypothetical protein